MRTTDASSDPRAPKLSTRSAAPAPHPAAVTEPNDCDAVDAMSSHAVAGRRCPTNPHRRSDQPITPPNKVAVVGVAALGGLRP